MKGITYKAEELTYTTVRTGDPTYINCNFKYIYVEILALRGFVLLKVLKLIEIPNLQSSHYSALNASMGFRVEAL
jgi:hypothetical protein